MIQNIVSGIVEAILGAIILYFLLGIPGKFATSAEAYQSSKDNSKLLSPFKDK